MPYIRKVLSGRSIHLAVTSCSVTRCRGRARGVQAPIRHPGDYRGRFMRDRASELRGILLPRTSVNKGNREGPGRGAPRSIAAPRSLLGALGGATLVVQLLPEPRRTRKVGKTVARNGERAQFVIPLAGRLVCRVQVPRCGAGHFGHVTERMVLVR